MSRHKTTLHSEPAVLAAGELGAASTRLSLPDGWARPFTVDEALDAARILSRSWAVRGITRTVLLVGVVYDLMPNDLTPKRDKLAKRFGISREKLDEAEMVWESFAEEARLDLIKRAVRIVLASRGAA